MENKRKILIINTSGLGIGGITTHMLNYIEKIQDNIECTIVVTGQKSDRVLNEFSNMKCKLVFLPDRKKETIKYIRELRKVIKSTKFDVLHVHGNSSTMTIELFLGKCSNIPIRIAHCHNSICENLRLHKILLHIFKHCYTQALACSELAGNWIFGENNFDILPNAIDIDKFKYNPEIRREYRLHLDIDDKTTLIGHVGNFNEQKNHQFIIELFEKYEQHNDAKLVLIGDGALCENIKKMVCDLGLQDKVFFLGVRDDVNCWLQAMDLFLFPSKWEGFGMVLIEAQVSNLPIVASTEVPIITKVSNGIRYIDIKDDINEWENTMTKLLMTHKRNKQIDQRIKKYDILENVDYLCKIYNTEC